LGERVRIKDHFAWGITSIPDEIGVSSSRGDSMRKSSRERNGVFQIGDVSPAITSFINKNLVRDPAAFQATNC
jgi:hypothetical protein